MLYTQHSITLPDGECHYAERRVLFNCHYAEFRYTECRSAECIMLNVIMLNALC